MTIAGNLVHDNGRNGIMLHRSCDDSTIANNEAYQNGDAGAAIFETSNTTIYGNNFFDNRCEQRLLLLLPAIGRVSPIFTLASGAQKKPYLGQKKERMDLETFSWRRQQRNKNVPRR